MIRIKVWSLREILYRVILIFICIFIFCVLTSIIVKIVSINKTSVAINIVEEAIPSYSNNKEWTRNSIGKKILNEVFPILGLVNIDDYTEIKEGGLENDDIKQDSNLIINDQEKLFAEKLSDSKYRVGSVYINDYSKLYLDLDKLSEATSIRFSNNLSVLIYHTHTSESYTHPKEQYEYSDYYRTENDEYNVVRVGEKLTLELNKLNIKVVHDKTKHDYPSYNGAYKASLKTVEKQKKNNNFDFFIDIHRDALAGNAVFRPTTEIEGKSVAKLMFVVGTNSAGLEHDNWMENLKFAIAIQEKANEMYPGLFRDLHLSSSRYNQHVSNNAIIIEAGATGNTLEEAELSMEYFSKVIEKLMINN